jgi:hypothetical protein
VECETDGRARCTPSLKSLTSHGSSCATMPAQPEYAACATTAALTARLGSASTPATSATGHSSSVMSLLMLEPTCPMVACPVMSENFGWLLGVLSGGCCLSSAQGGRYAIRFMNMWMRRAYPVPPQPVGCAQVGVHPRVNGVVDASALPHPALAVRPLEEGESCV